MIIFLDESLVVSLNNCDGSQDKIIGALAICAQRAREGVHLLVANRKTFDGLEAHYSKMEQRTRSILQQSADKLTTRKQVREFVRRAIRLVSDDVATSPERKECGGRVEIVLPASVVDGESSLVGYPLLMVENINDGHAYLKLARSLATGDIFPGIGWLRKLVLRCEIAPGGGHTLADLFAYHNTRAARIGIAIADGDYRYVGGGMGTTAGTLQKTASTAPTALLEAVVLSVRAVENCIPRAEVARVTLEVDADQGRRFALIQQQFERSPWWGVVPINAGIRCFELGQATEESQFWTGVFEGRQCAQEQRCTNKDACSTFVLEPISKKLLKQSVCSEREVFEISANCLSGLEEVWRDLLGVIYSMFCGTDPSATP